MYGFVSPINLYGIMVVVLRFFTDYKSDKGVLVVVPSRIAKRSLKGWLLLDFAGSTHGRGSPCARSSASSQLLVALTFGLWIGMDVEFKSKHTSRAVGFERTSRAGHPSSLRATAWPPMSCETSGPTSHSFSNAPTWPSISSAPT